MVQSFSCQAVVGGVDEPLGDSDCRCKFLFHEIGDLGKVDLVDLKHCGQLIGNVVEFLVHHLKMLFV
jgi:hypothetical protein